MNAIKRYLMSQYGMYISKIRINKCWLNVDLSDELRSDKDKYVKAQSDIQKTCELVWNYPNNICVG